MYVLSLLINGVWQMDTELIKAKSRREACKIYRARPVQSCVWKIRKAE